MSPLEHSLFAEIDPWPNSVDSSALTLFVALAVGLPVLGYVLLALDIRRAMRALRGALVRVVGRPGETPAWAAAYTPRPIAAFGLDWPCSEEDLKQAYREKVKHLHPDRGGDRRRFQMLQSQFEEAIALIRKAESGD